MTIYIYIYIYIYANDNFFLLPNDYMSNKLPVVIFLLMFLIFFYYVYIYIFFFIASLLYSIISLSHSNKNFPSCLSESKIINFIHNFVSIIVFWKMCFEWYQISNLPNHFLLDWRFQGWVLRYFFWHNPYAVNSLQKGHQYHFPDYAIIPLNLVIFLSSQLVLENRPNLSLQSGKTPPNECPRYDTKESDGEVSVMLELWEM